MKLRKEFKPIEAIVILGESPLNWESSLQLIIDLILTNGDPRGKNQVQATHLPVFVLGKKEMLSFFSGAVVEKPRISNGAFIECLQVLYKVCKKIIFCISSFCPKLFELIYLIRN